VAGAGAGVCSDTGDACSTDAECDSQASCFLPPGACLLDVGPVCELTDSPESGCPVGTFCVPDPGLTTGSCHERQGQCKSDGDCSGGAFCSDAAQDIQRALAPAKDGGKGEQLFTSKGLCLENVGPSCASSADCAAGQLCEAGSCQIAHGTCADSDDCPEAAVCQASLVVAAAADQDADFVADPFDNCPRVANVAQTDLDQDGIGDACDLATCGDGVQAYQEGCDDGNRAGGDACDATCQPEGVACDDGVDSDGDGLVDHASDPGCASAADPSERDPGLGCDDGADNDGDRAVDYPSDPECASPADPTEAPDADSDGVPDAEDNCLVDANPGQVDTSQDGFGNACDADWNEDGVVGGPEILMLGASFGRTDSDPGFDPDMDSGSDGVIGGPELLLIGRQFGGPPGPSGLACAGSPPCP
jgi:cysteine-rich repeat protein